MKLNLFFSFAFILVLSNSALASSANHQFENLMSLQIQAENFIKNSALDSPYPAIISIKKINSRLKLKQCNTDVHIEYNNQHKKSGNTLLKLSCVSPVKWRMHLPVNITLFQDVLVLKNPVTRSQIIDESDVIVKKTNEKYLIKGFYTHLEQLRYLETKRELKSGTILSPSNLKAKKLIKSGQQVTLQLNASGLGIKVSATALHSASKGQLIKVRNNNSLKVIEGTVKDAGLVFVNL